MRKARNFQEILDLLDIDFVGRTIEAVHEMIREHYPLKKYVAEDHDEFVAIVTHYYQYHHACWLNVPLTMPMDMAYSQVRRILNNMPMPDSRLSRISGLLDSKGGYVAIALNAIRGRNRGLVGALDAIMEAMKEEAVNRHCDALFKENFSPRDYDKRVAFAAEYLKRYAKVLLPGEYVMSPYELAPYGVLEKVFQNHARLINEFRKFLQ